MSADLALLATTLGLPLAVVPPPQAIVSGVMGGGSTVAVLVRSWRRGPSP
jgi:hypothetical protein